MVIRNQLGNVPGVWSVCYRFSVAAIGMFILAKVMRLTVKLDRAGHGLAMMLGLTQFCLNFNFVYLAEKYIASGLVAVIFALLIIPNALFSRIWLGHRVARGFAIGSLIAIAGVALLMLHEYRVAPVGGAAVLYGSVLTCCAVLCASTSNVMQASKRAHRYPVVTMIGWAMFWGACLDAIWAFLRAGPPVIDTHIAYLGGVFYLGLIGSVIAFPLYFALIRNIGPGKAAYTSVFIPVVAMLLSTLFENYHWSVLAGSGAALVIAGLLVAMQARSPAA